MNDADGSEVPQLCKCGPEISGNFETCDSGDWSLVAESGYTGKTDFGDSNNKYTTMLIVNGNYLYVVLITRSPELKLGIPIKTTRNLKGTLSRPPAEDWGMSRIFNSFIRGSQ